MDKSIYFYYNASNPRALLELYDSIYLWVNSKELEELVNAFGVTIPSTSSLSDKVQFLLDFSDMWDYRNRQQSAYDKAASEKMRWMISSSEITNIQSKFIKSAINKLGLLGIDKPLSKSFDYILVLGGARLSCLLRTRLAAHLYKCIDNLKAIALLAAYRPISESERVATNTYAPEAKNEFDLMNAAAKNEFDLLAEYEEKLYQDNNPNNSWSILKYRVKNERFLIYSLAAPSSEPNKRRANSTDTYNFFLNKVEIEPYSSLLLITSQIYVPYQQLEAIRALAIPRYLTIETIGFPIEWNLELQGLTEPSNYLQEIRSTIQSIDRLMSQYSLK